MKINNFNFIKRFRVGAPIALISVFLSFSQPSQAQGYFNEPNPQAPQQPDSGWLDDVYTNVIDFLDSIFGSQPPEPSPIESLLSGDGMNIPVTRIDRAIEPIVQKRQDLASWAYELANANFELEQENLNPPFESASLFNLALGLENSARDLQTFSRRYTGQFSYDEISPGERDFSKDLTDADLPLNDIAIVNVGIELGNLAQTMNALNVIQEVVLEDIQTKIQGGPLQKTASTEVKATFRKDADGYAVLHKKPSGVCLSTQVGASPYNFMFDTQTKRDALCRKIFEYTDVTTKAVGRSTAGGSNPVEYFRTGRTCKMTNNGSPLDYYDVKLFCTLKTTVDLPGNSKIKVAVRKAYFKNSTDGALYSLPGFDRTAPVLTDSSRYLALTGRSSMSCSALNPKDCKRMSSTNYVSSCAQYTFNTVVPTVKVKFVYTGTKMDGDGCTSCNTAPELQLYEAKAINSTNHYTKEKMIYTFIKPENPIAKTVGVTQIATFQNIKTNTVLVCRNDASHTHANIKVISVRDR